MAHFAEIKQSDNIVIRVIVASDNDLANNGGEYSTRWSARSENNNYYIWNATNSTWDLTSE